MESISDQETFKVFKILTSGRSIDKYVTLENLSKPDYQINRGLLRTQIIYSLSNEYKPQETTSEKDDDKDPKAMVRRFLLNALARISDNDKDSYMMIRKHLNPDYEPNRWVRSDILGGLVAANAPYLTRLAEEVRQKDKDWWPQTIATAILAQSGDEKALDEIRAGIKKNQNSTLRALRIVPIEAITDELLILAKPTYPKNPNHRQDKNYNAVVALGCIPNTWKQVEDAVDVLLENLKYCHKNWWLVGLWAKTLEALGNLRVARSSSSIIEELTSENPSIILEASRALEKVLGVSTAVARVVEAASNADQIFLEGYSSALRWMKRDLVVEKLEEMMVSGPVEQQETARTLLVELGGLSAFQKVQARRKAISQYTDQLNLAEEQIRALFETSIHEAQKGFKLATNMDLAVFIVGLFLIVISASLALIEQGNLDAWAGVGLVSGGAGVLGVLYALIKDPRKQIQKEVDHLMHLKVVFLGYLRQLHQADQAYTRRLLEDEQITPAQLLEFSDLIEKTMRSTVAEIRHLDEVEKDYTYSNGSGLNSKKKQPQSITDLANKVEMDNIADK